MPHGVSGNNVDLTSDFIYIHIFISSSGIIRNVLSLIFQSFCIWYRI